MLFCVFHNVWEISIWIEAQMYLQNDFEENPYLATTRSVIDCKHTKYHVSEWSVESGIAFRERYTQRHAGTRNWLQNQLQNKLGSAVAKFCTYFEAIKIDNVR